MRKHGKKFTAARTQVAVDRTYSIEDAVPRTDRIADSTESQFKSGSFCLAMASTCLAVTVPTFVLFGSPDPFAMFAARLSSTAAGGGLVMNVYDRSE